MHGTACAPSLAGPGDTNKQPPATTQPRWAWSRWKKQDDLGEGEGGAEVAWLDLAERLGQRLGHGQLGPDGFGRLWAVAGEA
jgi:hypothetical protein